MKHFAIPCLLALVAASCDKPGSSDNTTVYENIVCNEVILCSDDGYLLTGKSWDYSTGNDLLVMKFSQDLSMEWKQQFDLTGDQSGYTLLEAEDGYLVGGQNTNAWLVKVGPEGNTIWDSVYFPDAAVSAINSISALPDGTGDFIVSGYINANPEDLFIQKVDRDGNRTAYRLLEGVGKTDLVGFSVIPVSDQFIVLTNQGYFICNANLLLLSSFSFSGNPVFSKAGAMVQDETGLYIWGRTSGSGSYFYRYNMILGGDQVSLEDGWTLTLTGYGVYDMEPEDCIIHTTGSSDNGYFQDLKSVMIDCNGNVTDSASFSSIGDVEYDRVGKAVFPDQDGRLLIWENYNRDKLVIRYLDEMK